MDSHGFILKSPYFVGSLSIAAASQYRLKRVPMSGLARSIAAGFKVIQKFRDIPGYLKYGKCIKTSSQ